MNRVLIMAGGTGGHVFPALAAARAFQEKGLEVRWLGTQAGIEARVVPDNGIPIEYVDVAGVRGQGLKRLLVAPFKVLGATFRVVGVVRAFEPDFVLGMGGFVTGPGGVGAWLMRKPLFIHEQNAVAGLTNRLLARIATRVYQAFPHTFELGDKVETTGNPVRNEIAAIPCPSQRMGARKGKIRVLVLGGSQGAVALNRVVPEALALIDEEQQQFEVRHQAGSRNFEDTLEHYNKLGVNAEVMPFIDAMEDAYQWADLVVCRSGALTVFELAAAGSAALLVPYPHAVDDHQTRNGEFLVSQGAALMVQQKDLTAEKLACLLTGEFNDRARLMAMGMAARGVTTRKATDDVISSCIEAAYV